MTTYVCGHRNPDTDSVVAAISYAALCNMLGENDYVPVRLGHLNDETKFLLNRFGFQPPLKITTVRTQVRDVEFDKPPRLAAGVPVSYAWNLMQQYPNLSVLPERSISPVPAESPRPSSSVELPMRSVPPV